jgi:polysaccharide export outer membrane protein
VRRFLTEADRFTILRTIVHCGASGLVLLLCIGLATAQQAHDSATDSKLTTQLIAQNSGLQQSALNTTPPHKSETPVLPDSSGAEVKTSKVKQTSSPDPNAYVIGEQDTLMITVWKEKEISGSVVVRPDGKITVPLVGEIAVVGMTPVQVQAMLTEKLKPFVTVPQVSVAVTEIRSRKVYLIGHSAKEGSFTINSTSTVLQIIAQAGGLKDYAKRKKIYILRQQGSEQLHLPFNYENVIRGKNVDQNVLLQPGDTIVVP